jgi:hypothetical protein
VFNKRLLNIPHPGAKYSLFGVVPSCYPRSRENEDRTRDSARNRSRIAAKGVGVRRSNYFARLVAAARPDRFLRSRYICIAIIWAHLVEQYFILCRLGGRKTV